MTQFPLGDNLHAARKARDENYAGTLSSGLLVWFTSDRRFTLPACALAAGSALIALCALVAPAVVLDPRADYHRHDLLSPMLGRTYTGVWIVLLVVLLGGVLAGAASTWSGGPAPHRRGNPLLVAACLTVALAAIAVSVFLLAHTFDLALEAQGRVAPIPMPKGAHGWNPGPFWPYVAFAGPALWLCLAAGLVNLVASLVLVLRAIVTGRTPVTLSLKQANEARHLTSPST